MTACEPRCDSPQASHPARLPLAFWGLMLLAVAIRIPGIARPLLGNFSTKSDIYAMIARNWAEGRASLWFPTLDCMAGGQRSLHMLEFPASAYLSGWCWRALGGSLDVWGRATSLAFIVGAVALLFLLVRRRHGPAVAYGAAAVLALSPVAIIYGQAFMLEASLVFFTVATFDALDRWLTSQRIWWLMAAAASLALLVLTKIYMLVILLPLGVMVLWPGPRRLSRRSLALTLAAGVLAIIPAAAWYLHAMQTAAPGSPYARHIFYSVRDSAAVHRPPHPLLWSPDFYRRLFDDLVGVVLTPLGFGLLLLGFLDRGWRQYWSWLLAMALLVAALPLKFYEMNYYYLVILPPLCILAGLGWKIIHERLQPSRAAIFALVLLSIGISLRYALRPAFVTPPEDRAVLAAAQAVRERTGKDEPVVTMHGSAIDLLYYCDRPGWAVFPDTPDLESVLEACGRQGARLLVVAGPGATGCLPASAGTADPQRQENKTLADKQPVAPDFLPASAGEPILRGDGFCLYRIGPDDAPRTPVRSQSGAGH